MDAAERPRKFPWYDSPWMQRYVEAKAYLSAQYPQRLADFEHRMQILRTRPDFTTTHLPSVFAPEVMAQIRSTIATLRPEQLELHEMQDFGRWIVQDNAFFTAVQASTVALVSKLVGELVEPCYNFLSMYTRFGRCPLHMDAPLAKWTLDICINQSEPWDIHFSQVVPWPEQGIAAVDWEAAIHNDPANHFSTYAMQPGEALLFAGSSQWHYRNAMPNAGKDSHCDLLFFHFCPAGTKAYIHEESWPAYFGIPGLKEIISRYQDVRGK